MMYDLKLRDVSVFSLRPAYISIYSFVDHFYYLKVSFISSFLSLRTDIEARLPRVPNIATRGIRQPSTKVDRSMLLLVIVVELLMLSNMFFFNHFTFTMISAFSPLRLKDRHNSLWLVIVFPLRGGGQRWVDFSITKEEKSNIDLKPFESSPGPLFLILRYYFICLHISRFINFA